MSLIPKITAICAVIAAAAYAAFRHISKINISKIPVDETLTDKKFQRINNLNLPDLLQWVEDNIPNEFTKGKIRIFPQDKTPELMNKRVDIPRDTLLKCVYFDVVNEEDTIVLYKLVLPNSISEDLSIIKQGKLYCIPLER